MTRLVWSVEARRDLDEAVEYIARDNPAAALGQLEAIRRQADMLREHSLLGRVGRVSGTRELVIARTSYVLVYRVRDDVIEVARVLHGARRWPPQ